MPKAFRLTFYAVLLTPVLAVALVLGLAFYVLEQEPLVEEKPPANYAAIVAGKELLKRVNRQIESARNEPITVVISERELEDLARLGAHTFNWFNAESSFVGTSIQSQASIQMIPNPAGDYLNVSARVDESGDGIHIDRVSIGPMAFSGRWLLPLAARLADALLGDGQGSILLDSVRGVRLFGRTALFTVSPPPDVKENLKHAVRELQAARLPPGEQERVVHYYDLLTTMGEQWKRSQLSLDAYLAPLMAEAVGREKPDSAIAENRAAIWALAIYFSNGAFETLLGKLVSSDRTISRSPRGVSLAGRQDLMLHFIYSAGITLATQQDIGFAAGEFKELLDSGSGGSGFSFVDLAADRAGIAFVEAATTSESAARQLQRNIVSHKDESAYFPGISGLSEGLSDAQFTQLYGNTESKEYRSQVDLIDERIARLPVYQVMDP